jgi:hypothetical protein
VRNNIELVGQISLNPLAANMYRLFSLMLSFMAQSPGRVPFRESPHVCAII